MPARTPRPSSDCGRGGAGTKSERSAEEGFDALLEAVTEHDPDWLAVYFEFGRLRKADAALRDRWLVIAPAEARDRSRGWTEAGQAAGELRSDVTAEELAQFLGVVLDGILAQPALGFDPPPSELVLRVVRDATHANGEAAQPPPSSSA